MKKLTMLFALALAILPALYAQITPPPGTTPPQGTCPSVLTSTLNTSSLVPPITGSTNSGKVTMEIRQTLDTTGNPTQATVDYLVDHSFTGSQTINSIQVFKGAAGANGTLALNPTFGPPLAVTAPGSFTRQQTVTTATDLATVKDLIANPSGYYFVVNTAANPTGGLRGQLAAGTTDLACTVNALSSQLDRIEMMVREIGRVLGLTFTTTPQQ